MEEHVALLREQKLPIPRENPNPTIVIQNQDALAKGEGQRNVCV
jgi:hypothetical protein